MPSGNRGYHDLLLEPEEAYNQVGRDLKLFLWF
jgi:hypothetical protein